MLSSGDKFVQAVQDFIETTPQEAETLLNQAGTIIFVGRKSCSYCWRFAATLHEVQQQKDLTIYWLNSEANEYYEELQNLRSKYGVVTVPGLLYSNHSGVQVRCDSSMSSEEIINFTVG